MDLFRSTLYTIISPVPSRRSKDLSYALKQRGYNVAQMHSDLGQAVREQVIRDFKNRAIDVLVATDIVARELM